MAFLAKIGAGILIIFGSLWSGTLGFLHLSPPVATSTPQTVQSSQTSATTNAGPVFSWAPVQEANDNSWGFGFSQSAGKIYVIEIENSAKAEFLGADPTTFIVGLLRGPVSNGFVEIGIATSTTGYAKDNENVYSFYITTSSAGVDNVKVDIINGADPATFHSKRSVSGPPTYDAQDKNHKYYNGQIVQESSTTPLDVAEKTPVSPDTSFYHNDWLGWKWYPLDTYFRGASADFFGDYYNQYRDIDGIVYYLPGDAMEMTKMLSADAATFEFAYSDGPPGYSGHPERWGVGLKFGRDKNSAYWHGSTLVGSDPATFTPIFDSHNNLTLFSKDKNYVWYKDQAIPGANPLTFQVVVDDYSRPYNATTHALDENHRYDGVQILQ